MTIKRIFSGVKRLASARVMVLVVSVVLAGVLASGVAMTAGPGPAKAAFPGKNGRIAFTSNRTTEDNPNGYEQIFTMKPDGSGLKQITHYDNPSYYDIDGPSYSANGRRIAYAVSSIPAPGEVESHLYTIPARGGAPKQITISPDMIAGSPSWSPDGNWIAFDDGSNIYIIPAQGGVPKQLTHSENIADYPAWSPNGKRIAYGATDDDDSANVDFEIYTIPARGGTPKQVTHNRTDDYSPAWSPDGKMIAYTNWDDFGREDIIQIYTVPAHGGSPMQLTHTNYSYGPAWSPDGSKIAYEALTGNWEESQIFTIPAKGGSPKQLTHDGSNGAPDWQPLP
jgi:Tol biopolymer transport system component